MERKSTMDKPLLQVALDHTSLPEALVATRALADHVDVLEAGTILCAAEGVRAVETIRALYPDHIVLADLKVADAGAVLAEMVFSRGATWMTVICCAPLATMEKALEVARRYDGDIQIELYGDWTFDQAEQWKALGLRQAIYHRGRDAQAAGKTWDDSDLDKIRRLADMGFLVSVTGGLTPADIPLFKGIPVKAFISGRTLYGDKDPARSAIEFREAIDASW
jgi:3-dehydro-L-gulonate-6-phosphate decarboxylase